MRACKALVDALNFDSADPDGSSEAINGTSEKKSDSMQTAEDGLHIVQLCLLSLFMLEVCYHVFTFHGSWSQTSCNVLYIIGYQVELTLSMPSLFVTVNVPLAMHQVNIALENGAYYTWQHQSPA